MNHRPVAKKVAAKKAAAKPGAKKAVAKPAAKKPAAKKPAKGKMPMGEDGRPAFLSKSKGKAAPAKSKAGSKKLPPALAKKAEEMKAKKKAK